MEEYSFRKADKTDIPFVARTILEAEKSGTDILTYTTLMGMEEEEALAILTRILDNEDVDPCEISLGSFFVATASGEVVAACSMWIEGEEGLSSAQIKAIALQQELTSVHLMKLVEHRAVAGSIAISREQGTLQVGVVFTHSAHRGKGLAARIIEYAIDQLDPRGKFNQVEVQVFGNNQQAIRAYGKLGFKQTSMVRGDDSLRSFFPSNEKLLMQLSLTTKNNG